MVTPIFTSHQSRQAALMLVRCIFFFHFGEFVKVSRLPRGASMLTALKRFFMWWSAKGVMSHWKQRSVFLCHIASCLPATESCPTRMTQCGSVKIIVILILNYLNEMWLNASWLRKVLMNCHSLFTQQSTQFFIREVLFKGYSVKFSIFHCSGASMWSKTGLRCWPCYCIADSSLSRDLSIPHLCLLSYFFSAFLQLLLIY